MKKFRILSLAMILAGAAVFTACKDKDKPLQLGDPNTYTYGDVTQKIAYAGYYDQTKDGGALFFGLCPTELGKRDIMVEEDEWVSFLISEDLLDCEIELIDPALIPSPKLIQREPPVASIALFMFRVGEKYYYYGLNDGSAPQNAIVGTMEISEGKKDGEFDIKFEVDLTKKRTLTGNYRGIFEEAGSSDDLFPIK